MRAFRKEKVVELAKRAKNMNDDSFRDLYEMKWKDIYYSALTILGNESDAQDATQETFISAYKYIGKLQNPAAVNAWLYKILINNCNKILKGVIERRTDEDIDEYKEVKSEDIDFIPQDYTEKSVNKEIVLDIISKLPLDQRTTILMFYFQQMSHEEISKIENINVKAVAARLNRGRANIKKRLTELKEKGVLLYSAIPAGLMTKIFKEVAEKSADVQLHDTMQNVIAEGIGAVIAGGTLVVGASATTTATSGVTQVAVVSTVKGVVAVTAAVAIITAGVWIVKMNEGPQAVISSEVQTPSVSFSTTTETIFNKKEEEETLQIDNVETNFTGFVEDIIQHTLPEKEINSVSDMIGTDDFNLLESYKEMQFTDQDVFEEFMAKHNMKLVSVQIVSNTDYNLVILEQRDKRLVIILFIDRTLKTWNIRYKFTEVSEQIPKDFDLMFQHKKW